MQGSYGHGKHGKVLKLTNGYFQALKSPGKNIIPKALEKS